MSGIAEWVRVRTLEDQARLAMDLALSASKTIRVYLDAGFTPPDDMVSRFLAQYGEAERLYFEYLIAREAAEAGHDAAG
jgi:hypothetical protein